MNGESYRGASASGRVINRSGSGGGSGAGAGGAGAPSYRSSASDEPRSAGSGGYSGGGQSHQSQVPGREKGKKSGKIGKRIIKIFSVIALVLVIVLAGWLVWDKIQNRTTAIDASKYQAVFLTNGQFYFGKLQMLNNEYVKLTDVYYMQTDSTDSSSSLSTTNSTTSSDSSNYKLIKLGSEIHGPEDAMMIAKDQILYYENIKSDSKVGQLIKQDSGK